MVSTPAASLTDCHWQSVQWQLKNKEF